MKIYDITVLLEKDIEVYPGDPGVDIHQIKNFVTDGWNLTKFSMGSHTGSHLDTPLHISENGIGIDSLPLHQCLGKCKVVDFTHVEYGKSISPVQLKAQNIEKDDIILFKTRSSTTNERNFRPDSVCPDLNAAKYLVKMQIKAIGIDHFTIGPSDIHTMFLQNRILVYESLNLHDIKSGEYFFIGLPLKIKAEGSPVRAVLIEDF
ncbi:MAG: cyclase family protein [Promethearchaeota archaeon]|nr:MAG: cyclase family protein [Candidatus Lokiarchaeota archaeon]